MPLKYTSEVPLQSRMASSLFSAMSLRARSMRARRSSALIGLAKAFIEDKEAIEVGKACGWAVRNLGAAAMPAVSGAPVPENCGRGVMRLRVQRCWND